MWYLNYPSLTHFLLKILNISFQFLVIKLQQIEMVGALYILCNPGGTVISLQSGKSFVKILTRFSS